MNMCNVFKLSALALLLFQLHACSGGDANVSTGLSEDQQGSGAKSLMLGFSSDQQMLHSLREAARAESSQPFYPVSTEAEASGQDTAASSSAQSTTTSGTNVQVSGVDEADLIKVNGDRLFALTTSQSGVAGTSDQGQTSQQNTRASLKLFQLSAPARLLEQTLLEQDVRWNGLYHFSSDETLILQGEGDSAIRDSAQSSYWWNGGTVALQAVSSASTSNLSETVWQARFDGYLVGSRRIGDTLYVVTEYGAPYVHPTADGKGNVDEISLSDWLPHWQFNGIGQGPLVSSADCYTSSVDVRRQSTRITTVIAIPIDAPDSLTTRCMLGTAETLFVSQDALYIGTTETYYEGWASNPVDIFFPASTSTDIHKFSFDGTLSYRGGVRLAGHLGWHPQQRSYRLGERDGVLSVVTSGSSGWLGGEQDHRLFTLAEGKQGLELKAQLPNSERPAAIGKPGERIYGTRALGEKVYVVTFLTTDPLYVIDVSDSSDPYIAGELEVPGFSDYLHPVSGDRLLGIGKSASTSDTGDAGRGGWYQGLRLSLFDVADPSAPSLINALEFGDRGTSSDLFLDFHALAWLDGLGGQSEFALPVNLYRYNSAPKTPWEFGSFVHRGMYRFSVTESGLSELSTALLPNGTGYDDNARTVLSSNGDAWFFDRGELYYSDVNSPAVLLSSQ